MSTMNPKEQAQDLEQAADHIAPPAKPNHQGEGGGRPTKYEAKFAKQAFKMCLLGATDKELADFFEVEESTINDWKLKHLKFSESIRAGKDEADAEVANSLYQRAKGYSHPEVDIKLGPGGQIIKTKLVKHYPPDAVAGGFWLKNRQRNKWRDKQEHDVEVHGNMTVETVDYSKAANVVPAAVVSDEAATDADR